MGEDTTGQGAGQPTSGASRRVTVTEAAWMLDTTVDALRERVQRGTIPHERDEYGRVWILVDPDRTRHDVDRDTTGQRQDYEPDALISEMRGRIEDLREQLEAERQAHAEARRLLAAALERIPAIEAPASPETPGEPTEGAETPMRPHHHPRRPGESRRRAHNIPGGGAGFVPSPDYPSSS